MNNYVIIENYYLLHKMGFIVNMNNFKIIYPRNKRNYITFNNSKVHMPSLMLKSFLNLKFVYKHHIIHLDNNLLNNNLNNLYYVSKPSLNTNHKFTKTPVQFVFILYQYNARYQLIKCHADLDYLLRTCYLANECTTNIIKKIFYNNYLFLNDFHWELKIEAKVIDNVVLMNEYINLNSLYYISNDHTHVINLNKTIFKINYDKHGNYYVSILDNGQQVKFVLEFYSNPNKYIINDLNEDIFTNIDLNNIDFLNIFNFE